MYLKIVSFNVEGLRDVKKRSDIFEHFKESIYDIICLQETHITPELHIQIQNEWGYISHWNPGTNWSAGVAILINNKQDIAFIQTKTDNSGRIISLEIKFNDNIYQIINIYSPTTSQNRPKFYTTLKNFLQPNKNIILTGDFNMVENEDLDRIYQDKNTQHILGKVQLKQLLTEHELFDSYRYKNKHKRVYTWVSFNKESRFYIDSMFYLGPQFYIRYSCFFKIHLSQTSKKHSPIIQIQNNFSK
jgi:exodeoxyribonuclease III